MLVWSAPSSFSSWLRAISDCVSSSTLEGGASMALLALPDLVLVSTESFRDSAPLTLPAPDSWHLTATVLWRDGFWQILLEPQFSVNPNAIQRYYRARTSRKKEIGSCCISWEADVPVCFLTVLSSALLRLPQALTSARWVQPPQPTDDCRPALLPLRPWLQLAADRHPLPQ